MKNLLYLLFVLPLLFSCGDSSSDAKEEIFKMESVYYFHSDGCNFNCDECDSNWLIVFSENFATLNAFNDSHSDSDEIRRTTDSTCPSRAKYEYDNETETISIISISDSYSSYVSSSCYSSIIGDYKYDSAKKLFISTKDSDCTLQIKPTTKY